MTQSEYIPGDWVKASDQLCRVEEVFVNRLTKEYEYTLVYPNGNSSRIVIGEIEPIPLTPEILEKNGWEHQDDVYFKEYSHRKLVVIDEKACIINESCSLFLCKVEFVHQLQHLLFGLGVNEEMNLEV